MEKDNKRGRIKARLIALGVALGLLAAAMGVTFWQYARFTAAYFPFDLTKMIIINCAGAVLLYLIVCHFLKKSFTSE